MKKRMLGCSWDVDGFLEPLVEVRDEGDNLTVTADLPGVEKENIEVHASDHTLELRAKMRKEHRFERWGTLQRSVTFSSFRKIIELPSLVDVENARTRFHKGILEIRLPKKPEGRKVSII